MASYVSEAVIHRLPGYYRHLRELEAEGITQISSQELGARMGQTSSQIRQDINCFGGFGRQGYGYRVSELKERIAEILGLDQEHRMVIIGAGSIGTAVACYPTFSREKFRTLAMFDISPARIGQHVQGIPVLDAAGLEAFLRENPVEVAVLAVPRTAAQQTMDILAACGVPAVWNFAPADLHYDAQRMEVVNVHLSESLQVLSYKLKHHGET